MEMNDVVTEQMFARHETFHPRHMWLKKAYDRVSEDQAAFRQKDALIRFGVGKNMVNAIRFWSQALKVTEPIKHGMAVTEFGKRMFGDGTGLDPYLERPETLWVLHWRLLSAPCVVPVWWIMLNEVTATVVDIDEAHNVVWRLIEGNPEWNTPSQGSVKRDMDVFLHMYASRRDSMSAEEYLDCPFRRMYLIRHAGRRSIRFTYGPKTGLTPQVVAYACVDFAIQNSTAESISVARLAVESGGVGKSFKLSEADITGYLEEVCSDTSAVSLTDINGAPHLLFRRDSLMRLLDDVYAHPKAARRIRR